MNQTTHIDFTGGTTTSDNPVLFPENNLLISFATREAAEAAIAQTNHAAHTAIRLYGKEQKHGA